MSKTNALLVQAQPFLRDQYANMRNGLGPRIAHTREIAVPMAVDMSNKAMDMTQRMRDEVLPVATKRAMLAAAVLRGAELEREHERASRWRIFAAATAAGAAIGASAYMWQRKRNHDMWTEEDIEARSADDDPAVADIR